MPATRMPATRMPADDPILSALDAVGEAAEFPRRHVIFTEGEPGDRLYLIRSGKVKLSRALSGGREHLLALLGPAEMFGEISLYAAAPRESTATAVTQVHVLGIDRSFLLQWIAHRPDIAEHLLGALARGLRRSTSMLTEAVTNDVRGRLAWALLDLTARFGSQHGGLLRVTHDLTQLELAQLVGASRETVNKALAEFTDRGLLRVEGRTVVILDPERLARRAR
ncbi:Crp/Fnr family transcriptional regulator [Saccharothrix syringae]|uniref:Crp/Fnr family transcriptional regulator n=1 Tax=Saccharothrix syringae TaxID=103733 RepID=A0A5Q0HE06_SACSY|nr:Crp/Fnr family transcriptional regulator [Saccharothrix syringae]